MSRIANSPVEILRVEVTISGQEVSAKGAKGSLTLTLHDDVAITQEESELKLSAVGSTKQAVRCLEHFVSSKESGYRCERGV